MCTFFTSITLKCLGTTILFCKYQRQFSISFFSFFFAKIDREISIVIQSGNMRGTKYIISQYTSFTVAISTERVNCIQLMERNATVETVLQYTTVNIVKNIQTFNICFNDRCTLLFYKSVIESRSFNINRYSKLTSMIIQHQDCNETFDPCDVTARSGSHLVTS